MCWTGWLSQRGQKYNHQHHLQGQKGVCFGHSRSHQALSGKPCTPGKTLLQSWDTALSVDWPLTSALCVCFLFFYFFVCRLCLWSLACASVTARVWWCPPSSPPRPRWSAAASCPSIRWGTTFLPSPSYPSSTQPFAAVKMFSWLSFVFCTNLGVFF